MKTIMTITVAVLALGYTGVAQAADMTQEASIYGAYQDTDLLSDGYGAGAKYLVSAENVVPDMPNMILGVDLRGTWLSDFDEDSDLWSAESTLIVGYEIMDGMKPYIGAGIGGYFWDTDADVDDAFAGNAVVGWDQKVYKNVSVFAEGKYLYGDSDLEGFGANTGVSLNW